MAVKKNALDNPIETVELEAIAKPAPKKRASKPKEIVVTETEMTTEPIDDTALFEDTAVEPAPPAKAKKLKTPKEPKAEKPAKEPKAPNPYAGLSAHQRNRRIALEKYGTREGYTANDFRIVIDHNVRNSIQAILDGGTIRPSANGKSHGGDRYLIQLAKLGWPEGGATIVYPDQFDAMKSERTKEREAKQAENAEAKAAVKAEKDAAKAEAAEAKRIEREAAKAAKAEAKAAAKAEAITADEAIPASEFEAV